MTLVIILCCLGAYGVQNRAFDLYVTLGCGVLGYVLRHFRVPLAPLVISLVLGQQLEITIRQTIMLSREGFWVIFWQRPIAITISFITIFMLTYPFYKNWRRKSSALKQNGKG